MHDGVVVPGDQPRVEVTFDYDDESDPGPYPIPPNAPIEGALDITQMLMVVVVFFGDRAVVTPDPWLAADAPGRDEVLRIRAENLQAVLPGAGPGTVAAGPFTPLVYRRGRPERPDPSPGRVGD